MKYAHLKQEKQLHKLLPTVAARDFYGVNSKQKELM